MTGLQRDHQKDLEFLGQVCSGVTYPIMEHWIAEAVEKQQSAEQWEIIAKQIQKQLEAAEQERNELLKSLRGIDIECRRGLGSSHIVAGDIARKAIQKSEGRITE